MINFRDILSNLYADRSAEDLYEWLQEQNMLEPFKKTVAQLNSIISNEEVLIREYAVLPVGHIGANLLWALNTKIAAEGNAEQVKTMENLLGDVCSEILLSFLKFIKSEKLIILKQITNALKDTCDFQNYDYNLLIRFLKLETNVSYFQSYKSGDPVVLSAIVPSLCWRGDPKDLNDFFGIFIDQKLIKSKKGLAKLFENPVQSLQLQFEPAKADLILQFFYTLKGRKLVTYSGAKGLYQVMEFHILDFKKTFLKNRDAARRINVLRHSESKWNDNQQRIDSWLQSFKACKTGFRTVGQT